MKIEYLRSTRCSKFTKLVIFEGYKPEFEVEAVHELLKYGRMVEVDEEDFGCD